MREDIGCCDDPSRPDWLLPAAESTRGKDDRRSSLPRSAVLNQTVASGSRTYYGYSWHNERSVHRLAVGAFVLVLAHAGAKVEPHLSETVAVGGARSEETKRDRVRGATDAQGGSEAQGRIEDKVNGNRGSRSHQQQYNPVLRECLRPLRASFEKARIRFFNIGPAERLEGIEANRSSELP
jgi:hypothetical protein